MDLDNWIDQMAHTFTTFVFFFHQEYVFEGVITAATLVAPETELLNITKTALLLNGIFSMMKFGLANCYDGFRENIGSNGCCKNSLHQQASSILIFKPPLTSSTDIIDELPTLITAGCLGKRNQDIITETFKSAENQEAGICIAQQLTVTKPSLQTTNSIEFLEKIENF
eukprot:2205858-Ditylum_brightwellii.AAC.1